MNTTLRIADNILKYSEMKCVPKPGEHSYLIGHRNAEAELLSTYQSGHKQPAWLLSGPPGIGKATLAFRFAKFTLANPDPFSPTVQQANDLSTSNNLDYSPYPDLMHITKTYDERNERFKAEITITEIRNAITSMHRTPTQSNGRWVIIVDSVNDMNNNTANALLKVIEEPPNKNSIFILLAHYSGRVPRTLCSRCRRLRLFPLTDNALYEGLEIFGFKNKHNPHCISRAVKAAHGSLKHAMLLCVSNIATACDEIVSISKGLPYLDINRISHLVNSITKKNVDENIFHICCDLIVEETANKAKSAAISGNLKDAMLWIKANENISKLFTELKVYNLDKYSSLMSAFKVLSKTARAIYR